METSSTLSWGRLPQSPQQVYRLHCRHDALPEGSSLLPHGNGRSYGDSCLNPGGLLLNARGLDRFIYFDPASGRLACEAGMLLSEILDLAVPRGWFLPVSPGTRYVTVGGAIANDVHGKNHHRAGTFGSHVLRFELLRSDGSRRVCTPGDDSPYFSATIGGLGLTGLILWAEIQLRRIEGPCIRTETRRFGSLDEFFALSAENDRQHEYTVAWVDCAPGQHTSGRGLFSWGDHAPADVTCTAPSRRLRMPFTPPFPLVNRISLKLFNALYYRQPCGTHTQHYQPFLYPLDHIADWNRLYGPRGFFQYQCVVPPASAQPAIAEMLRLITRSGGGSFLAVLKQFGDRASPGLLSFPRPGTTLAVDFPNRGMATKALLDRLDSVVGETGGAVYPAKDARMSSASFQRYFPRWRQFGDYIDPQFSSAFWRRVMEAA